MLPIRASVAAMRAAASRKRSAFSLFARRHSRKAKQLTATVARLANTSTRVRHHGVPGAATMVTSSGRDWMERIKAGHMPALSVSNCIELPRRERAAAGKAWSNLAPVPEREDRLKAGAVPFAAPVLHDLVQHHVVLRVALGAGYGSAVVRLPHGDR